MTEARAALERLLAIGRGDTGQSRKVASFLLAWWNAGECGGFDHSIAVDMVKVFAMLAGCRQYPDSLGYGQQFEALARAWRR